MIRHHQTGQVLDALAQHQLVVFVGARGTGKTCLLEDVNTALTASGVTVIALDAETAQAPSDLMASIAVALQCPQDRLTAANLSDELRLRVLVDNCDALHEKNWFPAVQDEWRGLLGEPEARGRVAFLLCGRPLFRRVAEGRGSPLVGIGTFVPSRPLNAAEIESLGVDENVAVTVRLKTGGHPQLTRRLVDAIHGDVAELEVKYVEFALSQRRFLLKLIDDHGSATRAVLADLLDASRSATVAESAIIARHFGGSGVLGQDTIDDLMASGLVARVGGSCRLGAEILRTDRDIRQYLGAAPFTIFDEPSVEHAEAAGDLFRAENRLRRIVGSALAEVEDTWWPSRFPTNIVREVEQRRKSEADSTAPASADVHPIAYLTFGELVDSVLEESNWEQIFRVRLGLSRDAFTQAASVITTVRNKVAHNRPVSEPDLTVLRLASKRLGL
jgi:hypothetical protein